MLTPNEYDHLCDQLMQIYWSLDDAIIADITRRLMKTGGDYLPDMGVIQAERMQQAGLLYEDIINEVAKRSGMTQMQVAKTFERAGVQSIRNDNRSYRAAGLEGIVKMSDACLQTLNAGYVKCNGELQNLTLTTANTAQTAYLNACDLAYMQVSTGTLDYQTAIRRAVRAAADQGAFVLYPSGHRDRLDVAVRRSVLTGVGQTVRKLSVINAKDMDCDLMEISAHAGARPTHAAWQGKIVSLSGRRGYLSVKDIGWGDADGFGGINCRHDWYPFFEGISKRAYTDADLQALNEPYIDLGDGKLYTDYEVSQMQRALEREVRKCKRWVSGAAAGVDAAADDATLKAMQAELTDASVELKKAEKELQDFCNQIDVRNDKFRTEVNGFGRSEAQRAVWANRNAQAKSSLFSSLLEEFNNGQKDTIKFKNIEKELNKSEIGREYLSYLVNNPCKINLFYGVEVDDGLLGQYDPFSDEISIYVSNSKTIRRTTEVIIHELTHRRYGIGDCYWSECVCRAHEIMHRNRRSYLTEQERRSIIKEIKETYSELYPDWKWR